MERVDVDNRIKSVLSGIQGPNLVRYYHHYSYLKFGSLINPQHPYINMYILHNCSLYIS